MTTAADALAGSTASTATTTATTGTADATGTTTTTTGTTGAAQTGTTTTTGGSTAEWHSSLPDGDVKTWAVAKGWKDVNGLVESSYNLEKLIGFEKAGRTLVVPGEKATPEEVRAFHTKLGVPESPEGYKLPVPEGGDPSFAKTAANWMHEAGIPPKQAEQLATRWNEFSAAQQKLVIEQQNTKLNEDFGKTVAAWGKDADQNLEFAKRAASQFVPAGTPQERQEKLRAMEAGMGTEAFLKMWAEVGKNMGEHTTADAGGGNSGGMTPAAAQARIQALKTDKEWAARYVAGGAAEKAEMDRLHKIGYPE